MEKLLNGEPLNGKPLDGKPLNREPLDGEPLNGEPLNGEPECKIYFKFFIMSENLEEKIGTTPDGRLWMLKALDPAGQNVDVRGMPDVENHFCAVLNYQSQTEMSAPNLYKLDPSNNTVYDGDLFLYQHPLIFASGVTYPTGSVDPLTYSKSINVDFGLANRKARIVFQTGASPLFPRTAFRSLNSQLSTKDLQEMNQKWQEIAQRHRVIYGGAQIVPTCSTNDNSGSISVSQVFMSGSRQGIFTITPLTEESEESRANYRNRVYDYNSVLKSNLLAGGRKYPVTYYDEAMFPSNEDIMQNPQSLITRFYEGAYIPYKLSNPLETNFISSGQKQATRTPFWIVGAEYYTVSTDDNAGEVRNDLTNAVYVPHNMTWDYETQSFEAPVNGAASRIALLYQTYTGIQGKFIWDLDTIDEAHEDYVNGEKYVGFLQYRTSPLVLNVNLETDTFIGKSYSGALNTNSAQYLNYPKTFDYKIRDNPVQANQGIFLKGYTLCDSRAIISFTNCPFTAVHFAALNSRGNIKLMTRLGLEIVCASGSVYTPFVHIAPAYDDACIKNYIRVSHGMRDGFYGNSATPEFRQAYLNALLKAIWEPYVSVDFANRGAKWSGKIAAR